MHYMSESASSGVREVRRRETARRIHDSAQELADTHGLDGFSMEDLATSAGVSRRTLFNYFPGKDAAVLGDPLVLDPDLTDRFVAGGPTGHLVDDLVALVEPALLDETINPSDVARFRRLMAAEPRLVALAHQRFEEMGAGLLEMVAAREGKAHDPLRARIVIHMLAALFDISVTAFIEDPQRPFPDLYRAVIERARSAFA